MGSSPSEEAESTREPGNTQTRASTLSDSEDETTYHEIITEPPPAAAGRGGENVIGS